MHDKKITQLQQQKTKADSQLEQCLGNFPLPSGNRHDHPFRGSGVNSKFRALRNAAPRVRPVPRRQCRTHRWDWQLSQRNSRSKWQPFSRNVIRETETYAISLTNGFGGQHGRRGPCDRAGARCNGTSRPPVAAPTKKESKHWSQSAFGRDQNWRTSGESKQTWIRLDRLSLELGTMRAAAATAIQHGHIIEGPDFPA